MPSVWVKAIGLTSKREIVLDSNDIPMGQLRARVAEVTGMPLERLKLVLHGKPEVSSISSSSSSSSSGSMAAEQLVHFSDGDTLMALVAPRPPPAHISSKDGEIEDDEEELRFKLPETASALQRRIARVMKDSLKLPDYVLMVFFWLSLRTWGLVLLWFIMAPVLQLWELGPIYILVTCFCLIFLNLGRRKEGEASAYSIFNEGFRELPGTLNADRLDHDIRAGQF
eukprot:TRINITY_DN564_c0_g1_i2.p1 TRINITY_DN564_c0_g1~~TRINITY_DN564_c0_g1_i2.p1  ORF type:complete len:226 (+),score=36.39 TRINITY_DN564_c0_g1_i2:236-913(+)